MGRTKTHCAFVRRYSKQRAGQHRQVYYPQWRDLAGYGRKPCKTQNLGVTHSMGARLEVIGVGAWPRARASSSSAFAGRSPCLSLNTSTIGCSVVLSVTGEVNLASAPQFSEVIRAALRRGPKGLVCDLGDVSSFGAAGMTTLIRGQRQAAAWHTAFDIVCPQPRLRRVLALVGLGLSFRLYDRVADAVDAQAHRAGDPGSHWPVAARVTMQSSPAEPHGGLSAWRPAPSGPSLLETSHNNENTRNRQGATS
jgi:anti-sigma B factor antagonist